MKIEDEFKKIFDYYKSVTGKSTLSYVVTSRNRQGNINSNPHAWPENALDFTLRTSRDYSGIKEYNDLFKFMMKSWSYRAGIDNTTGNIHIHIDLGQNRPTGQTMPYFFKEDDGKFRYQIKTEADV